MRDLNLPGPLQSHQSDYNKIKKLLRVKTSMNYRAKKMGQPGRIKLLDLMTLIGRGMICFYCHRSVTMYEDNRFKEDALSFDHKQSMKLGGTNTIDNLVVSCRKCNLERNHEDQCRTQRRDKKPTNNVDCSGVWVAFISDPYIKSEGERK